MKASIRMSLPAGKGTAGCWVVVLGLLSLHRHELKSALTGTPLIFQCSTFLLVSNKKRAMTPNICFYARWKIVSLEANIIED